MTDQDAYERGFRAGNAMAFAAAAVHMQHLVSRDMVDKKTAAMFICAMQELSEGALEDMPAPPLDISEESIAVVWDHAFGEKAFARVETIDKAD